MELGGESQSGNLYRCALRSITCDSVAWLGPDLPPVDGGRPDIILAPSTPETSIVAVLHLHIHKSQNKFLRSGQAVAWPQCVGARFIMLHGTDPGTIRPSHIVPKLPRGIQFWSSEWWPRESQCAGSAQSRPEKHPEERQQQSPLAHGVRIRNEVSPSRLLRSLFVFRPPPLRQSDLLARFFSSSFQRTFWSNLSLAVLFKKI